MSSAVRAWCAATRLCHGHAGHDNQSPLAPPAWSSRTKASPFLKLFSLAVDRDRTVSQRSKPSSRTTLINEQLNPWNPLQLQDVMSRHRGAKRSRQCGLSKIISLLSLAYLLSVKRWPAHMKPPDHYGQPGKPRLLASSFASQLSRLMPLNSKANANWLEPAIARLRYTLGGDRPSQTNVLGPVSPGPPRRKGSTAIRIRSGCGKYFS